MIPIYAKCHKSFHAPDERGKVLYNLTSSSFYDSSHNCTINQHLSFIPESDLYEMGLVDHDIDVNLQVLDEDNFKRLFDFAMNYGRKDKDKVDTSVVYEDDISIYIICATAQGGVHSTRVYYDEEAGSLEQNIRETDGSTYRETSIYGFVDDGRRGATKAYLRGIADAFNYAQKVRSDKSYHGFPICITRINSRILRSREEENNGNSYFYGDFSLDCDVDFGSIYDFVNELQELMDNDDTPVKVHEILKTCINTLKSFYP